MKRSTYILSYDISDPKRLRRVLRLMRAWGEHLQLSVFRCELGQFELEQLQVKLLAEINSSEDQVLIISLGSTTGENANRIASLGRKYEPPHEGAIVV